MTLSKRLIKLSEFDAIAAEDRAIELGIHSIEINKPGIATCDTEFFDDGAEWENARLKPLLDLIPRLVETAEDLIDTLNKNIELIPLHHLSRMDGLRGSVELLGEALDDVERVVAEMEQVK